MSNHTSDEIQPEAEPPSGMLSPSETSASGSTTSTSTSIPSTLKKSKRQADRMVRAAFAATQRKEQEEDRFRSRSHPQLQSQSQPQSPPHKKPKARRRSKLDSEHRDGNSNNNSNSNSNSNTINNSNNANAKTDEREASRKSSQVVTPSPTHSKSQAILPSTTISKSHTKKKQKQKRSKAASQSPSQSQSSGEPGWFEENTNDKISSSSSSSTPGHSQSHRDSHSHDHPPHQLTHNRKRKRRKIVYKAISGSQRPIYGHALDLVALVCNNAYCVTKGSGGSISISTISTNGGPKSKAAHESAAAAIATSMSTESSQLSPQHISNSNSNATTPAPTPKPPHAPGSNSKSKSNDRTFHPQPHRILDRPRGYTPESEPLRERLLRLQLRQRFASATSMGMSPIEFARKLLKLWGGTLEQVYDETKASSALMSRSRSTPMSMPMPMGTGVATASARATDNATDNDDESTSMFKETIMTRIVSSEKSNNCSFLTRGKPKIETKSKPASRSRFEEELALASMSKADFESYGFDNSIGDLEPRSIHPDAQLGNSNIHGNGNGLLPGNIHAVANAYGVMMYDLNQPRDFNNNNNVNHLQHNTVPTKFDANSNGFGKRKPIDRIERAKKLKQKRHRKKLKEAEVIAVVSSSLVIDDSKSPVATIGDRDRESIIGGVGVDAPVGNTDQNDAMALASTDPSSSSSKRKSIKRSPRQLIEDLSLPVLYKDMRLTQPDDVKYLNALHCFVREQLLEVYVLQKNTGSSSSRAASASGGLHEENNNNTATATATEEAHNIVGIRCAWCGSLPKAERGKGQSMSTFFPKSVGEIYRGVCTWQRIHFPVCEHMPEHLRNEYKIQKERDLTRGKKAYWTQSACTLGLRNIDSERNGLTYQPGSPFDPTEYFWDPGDGRVRAKKPRGRSRNRKRPSSNEALRAGLENDNDHDSDHDNDNDHDSDHDLDNSGMLLSAFAGDEDHEFELFGTDFDQSLEESAEVQVPVTYDGETITATAF